METPEELVIASVVDGVVHVSLPGGGFFSARVAAGRERDRVLDAVRDQIRVNGRVHVSSGAHRWVVHHLSASRPVECHGCGVVTEAACFRDGVIFCVPCALNAPDEARRLLDVTGWDEA